MLIELLQNAALLSFTAIGLYLVKRSTLPQVERFAPVLIGISYGITAFLVTATPLMLAHGATVDARAGPVIVAGIVGGPVAACIAAICGALARGIIGGSFAFPGMMVYLVYACLGALLWVRFFRTQLGDHLSMTRLGGAAGLSVCGASLMFFIIDPWSMAVQWLWSDLPIIGMANTGSVLFCGLIALLVLGVAEQGAKLAQTLDTLELAKAAGRIGIWKYHVKEDRAEWDLVNRRLHGLPKDISFGRAEVWERTLHPDDLPRVRKHFDQALQGVKDFDVQYRVIWPNGEVRHLRGSAIVQRDLSGDPMRVVGANYDVTELFEQEQELEQTRSIAVQAQKLDVIGKLTGGVAHDFNNLLAIIQGNLEILHADEDKHSLSAKEREDILTSALSASQRGGELTKNMLAFARKSPLAPKPVLINSVLSETGTWLRRTIPASITIETDLEPHPWELLLDRTGLESAIVNIIVNARDAMPEGGRLSIKTRNVTIEKHDVVLEEEAIPLGRYIQLEITDTGKGIDPDLLPSVFEPFVSSKDMSLGSGLGLSMVQGFVRQSGGFVKLISDVGVGTQIRLFFPAVDRDQVDPPSASWGVEHEPVSPGKSGAKKRILLVEDQLEVLTMLVRQLSSAGYEIDTASQGDAALEIFREQGPYDLLLTDVIMPSELNGVALAKACRKISPKLPVIYLSGYASDTAGLPKDAFCSDIWLMKPVTRVELLSSIEACLSAALPEVRRPAPAPVT
ncbi:MAG: ATP-binding protein [Roseobacter sp.]